MPYYDQISQQIFNLPELTPLNVSDVTEQIVQFDVSLSLNGSSQIGVSVVDPAFTFARNNYFQVRRDVVYRNMKFEISAVSTQRSDSIHPLYQLECRSKAVQLMKRDKKPEAYRGMLAYDFAQAIAKRFSLNFVGEKTTKKRAVVKGKSNNADDSVWTVLTGLAQEQQFVCFESENTLFFCSEKFLLGKWGDPNYTLFGGNYIPFIYPEPTEPQFLAAADKYILLDQPQVRRSDDDIRAADGSMLVDRFNGVNLRPGMTIYLGGIPDFESFYLITDVQYQEGSPDPVQVQFRVPVDPTKEKVSSSGTSNKGGTTGVQNPGNPIGNPQGTVIIPPTVPKGVTATDARRFAGQALGFLNYRGQAGNVIKEAVAQATSRWNNKIPAEQILAYIRSYPGLKDTDREIAEIIFTSFAQGKDAKSLAVSGGLSSSAKQEVYDSFIRRNPQDLSNETPNRPRADTNEVIPNNVPQTGFPSSLEALVRSAASSLASNQSRIVKDRAPIEAVKAAKTIYNAPTRPPSSNPNAQTKRRLYEYYRGFAGSVNRPEDKVVFDIVWQVIRRNSAILNQLVRDNLEQQYIASLSRTV